MAIKIRRGQTGADSELTARLRKLQEASQVPPEPEVAEKTGRAYIDNIMQRRANASINPKQRDLEIEDYTYIQPDRILRQQVPPSRMITNPEEMEERLQTIARDYFPRDDRNLTKPYSRGMIDFKPPEEVSRAKEQELLASRQQDVRRFKKDMDSYLSKEDRESLAEDLISTRFGHIPAEYFGEGEEYSLRGRFVGDQGYSDLYAGFQDPNTLAVYTRPSDAEFYPGTMAHEYRHFTGSDEGTEADELFNRLLDTYTAQTPEELKDSIDMVIREEAGLLQRFGKIEEPGFNVEESVDELQKIIDSLDDPNVNLPQMFNKVVENSLFVNKFNNVAIEKQTEEKYKPSPFLTELLEAQDLGAQKDRRLAEIRKKNLRSSGSF